MSSARLRATRVLASLATVAAVVVVGVGISSGAAQSNASVEEIARLEGQARLTSGLPAAIARQLQRTKAALDKYRSVKRAIADGYAAASACTALPTGLGGESSDSGAMGIHFVSKAAMRDGKLDPTKPEILLYAPVGVRFKLVGAEYFKPDADQKTSTDDDRPTLFGRAFDGPMLGHDPGMAIHYDLHVWLWKRNPSGIFAPWNPALSCAA